MNQERRRDRDPSKHSRNTKVNRDQRRDRDPSKCPRNGKRALDGRGMGQGRGRVDSSKFQSYLSRDHDDLLKEIEETLMDIKGELSKSILFNPVFIKDVSSAIYLAKNLQGKDSNSYWADFRDLYGFVSDIYDTLDDPKLSIIDAYSVVGSLDDLIDKLDIIK